MKTQIAINVLAVIHVEINNLLNVKNGKSIVQIRGDIIETNNVEF